MTQKTRNFVLALSWQQDQTYQTKVLDSPSGEAEGTMTLPFNRNQFLRWAEEHGDLPKHSQGGPIPIEAPLNGLDQYGVGMLLYRALFQGAVKQVFESARVTCQENEWDLRIVLRFNPRSEHHLAAAELPWELMCDPDSREYLCLLPDISLVRYLEHPHKVQRPPMPAPLRILAVIPNPKGDADFQVKRFDATTVSENLKRALRKSAFNLHVLAKPTLDALFRHLVDHHYDVLHFVGHGGFIGGKGGLLFENDQGFCDLVDDQRFARTLAASRRLRLVHLVSCNTGVSLAGKSFSPFHGMAHALVGGKLPTVVAMQFLLWVKEVDDYCSMFYDRIADGQPLDKAVDTARLQLSLNKNTSVTWATPVIFLRDENAHLFQPALVQRVHLNSYDAIPEVLLLDYENQPVHAWFFQDFFQIDSDKAANSRRVTHPAAWAKIKDKLAGLKQTLNKKTPIHFEGNCVLSIWFIVGHYFSQSSGYQIVCRQKNKRTEPSEIWRMRVDITPMELEQRWVRKAESEEMIVSVNCIQQNFEANVGEYLTESPLRELPWLQLTTHDPSRWKLNDDGDAAALVYAVADAVSGLATKKIHLFLCVPSAVALFLGCEATLGKSFVVYEYQQPGYTPAFTLN